MTARHGGFHASQGASSRRAGAEAKSYFTGEDKIIVAKQRSGPAGTYVKVRFDGPERQVGGKIVV